MQLDIDAITDDDYQYVWQYLLNGLQSGKTVKQVANVEMFMDLCERIPDIKGARSVSRRKSPFAEHRKYILEPEFLESVKTRYQSNRGNKLFTAL